MNAEKFTPPPNPPPLLNEDQVNQLAQSGFLPLDIPASLAFASEDLFELSGNFFAEPLASKETQYPQAEATELGYYHIPQEKEYLTFRHRTSLNSLNYSTSKFWSLASSFLHRILCDLSIAFSVPLLAWDPLLDGCLSIPSSRRAATPTLLRLFNYFPNSGAAESHTDIGLMTLCIGTAPGLQVSSRASPSAASLDGQWLDVSTKPAVLVGKTLQWLSGGRLKAGLHRVVANPEGRQSIVFALRPSLRTRYFDLAPFGESSVVDLVGVWQEIRGSVFNVNAQTRIRTAQKEWMRAKGLFIGEEGESKGEESEDAERGVKMIEEEKAPGYS
ncbi:MAG: hypothetical protein LQ343_000479 [Gyalolechia ehrenbergii]|nr:MAG: hypothetical protein LQ343_000479 [Gyalolechia ehrenbergii]